jgi:hypothetical protein
MFLMRPADVERELLRLHQFRKLDVRRFFFVDRGSGPRARLAPAEELSREVTARTSAAVKATLKSLLDAPAAAGIR